MSASAAEDLAAAAIGVDSRSVAPDDVAATWRQLQQISRSAQLSGK